MGTNESDDRGPEAAPPAEGTLQGSLGPDAWAAIGDPTRRAILERLAAGELSVGEATEGFGVSKPAISRHLKVLEEAGAIVRVIDGRTHRLRARGHSLSDAADWMTRQEKMWERKLDVVEEYLREEREREATRPRKEQT